MCTCSPNNLHVGHLFSSFQYGGSSDCGSYWAISASEWLKPDWLSYPRFVRAPSPPTPTPMEGREAHYLLEDSLLFHPIIVVEGERVVGRPWSFIVYRNYQNSGLYSQEGRDLRIKGQKSPPPFQVLGERSRYSIGLASSLGPFSCTSTVSPLSLLFLRPIFFHPTQQCTLSYTHTLLLPPSHSVVFSDSPPTTHRPPPQPPLASRPSPPESAV